MAACNYYTVYAFSPINTLRINEELWINQSLALVLFSLEFFLHRKVEAIFRTHSVICIILLYDLRYTNVVYLYKKNEDDEQWKNYRFYTSYTYFFVIYRYDFGNVEFTNV